MDRLIDIDSDPSLALESSSLAQWQSAEQDILGACAGLDPALINDLLWLWPLFEPEQLKFRDVVETSDQIDTNLSRDDDGDERRLLDIIDLYDIPDEESQHFQVECSLEPLKIETEELRQQPPADVLDVERGESSIGTHLSLIDIESYDSHPHTDDNYTSPTVFSETISRPLSLQLLDLRGCHTELISPDAGHLPQAINASDYAQMVRAAEAVFDTDDDDIDDDDWIGHGINEHPVDCLCEFHGPYLHYAASYTSSAEDIRDIKTDAGASKERVLPSSSSWLAGLKMWIQSKRGKSRATRKLTKVRKTHVGFHQLGSGSEVNLAEGSAEASATASVESLPQLEVANFEDISMEVPLETPLETSTETTLEATTESQLETPAETSEETSLPLEETDAADILVPVLEEDLPRPPSAGSPQQRESMAITIDDHDCLEGDDAFISELFQKAKRFSKHLDPNYPPPHTASSEALPRPKLRDLDDSKEACHRYQCTFCTMECSSEQDWREHEASTHILRRGWTCTLNDSIDKVDSHITCAFCGTVEEGHDVSQHYVSVCSEKSIDDRTFVTDREIEHHLRKVHRHKSHITKMMRSWEWPQVMDDWYWNCGFCDMVLQSWEERQEHLIDEHFEKGMTMSSWTPLQSPYPVHRRSMMPVSGFPKWNHGILLTLQQTSLVGATEQSADHLKRKKPTCKLPGCNIAFADFSAFRLHMKLWHRAPRVWKCPNSSKAKDLPLFFQPNDDGDEEDTDCDDGGSHIATASQMEKKLFPAPRPAMTDEDFCICCGKLFDLDLESRRRHLSDVHHLDFEKKVNAKHQFFREEHFFLHLANAHQVEFEWISGLIPLCEQEGRQPALL